MYLLSCIEVIEKSCFHLLVSTEFFQRLMFKIGLNRQTVLVMMLDLCKGYKNYSTSSIKHIWPNRFWEIFVVKSCDCVEADIQLI